MMSKITKMAIFLLFLPFPYFSVLAANSLDIVINEIAWMGTENSANDEWIELYNNTGQDINLEGWGLYEGGRETLIEPLTNIIGANSYYLIERTDDTTVPNISASQEPSSWGGRGLKNSGEHLQLLDNNSTLIDEVNCSNEWFAGDITNKQTMERINPSSSGNSSSSWQISQDSGGTPKAENSVSVVATEPPSPPPEEPPTQSEPQPEPQTEPEPQPEPEPELPPQEEPEPEPQPIAYPFGIAINEIIPSPEGPNNLEEWIELKNLNDEKVNLSQWKIQDTIGSITTYTFPEGTKIGPKGFLVLSRPTTKITLNNSGDGLLLIQPNGNISNSVTYEKAPRGQSYNRTESGWAWSITLTPGAKNIVPSPPTETPPPSNEHSESPATGPSETLIPEPSQPPQPVEYPDNIIFNEILPSPEGPDAEDEWIEIFNQNDFEVDISSWKIQDEEGRITTYTFPNNTKISPKEYLVISRPLTKITLNNTGDELTLIQPDEEVADSIIYPKAPQGQSYNKITSGGWSWSSVLTPGKPNTIFQEVSSTSTSKKPLTTKKPEKQDILEKGTAAISEKSIPKTKGKSSTFLIALNLALFSGIAILILKRKLEEREF